jgi:hypothetical protein
MTAERAEAYGRVMKTLADMGPAKLQPRERDLVREAADAMLFWDGYDDYPEARMAFVELELMLERLIESDRWLSTAVDRLMRDVEECGPRTPVEALAA